MEKCEIVPDGEHELACMVHKRTALECRDARIQDLSSTLEVRDKQLDAAVKALYFIKDQCPNIQEAVETSQASIKLVEGIRRKMGAQPVEEQKRDLLGYLEDYRFERITLSRLAELAGVPAPVLRQLIVVVGSKMSHP